MDRHNDSIGRSLAEKHGNMLDVLEEALAHIHEGSGAPGGPVWITDHKPADFPAEAQEKARSAAKTTYEDPEPNKRLDPQIVDDDDLDRVEHMKSIAKTAPDEDPLALDKIFALFLYILTQIDQRDELAPVLEPGIPEDLRLDRLLEAVQKHRLTDLLPVEIGDTGVDRQKLLDEIRKRRLPDRTGSLQPRWSDPAPNIDAKQNNTTRPR